MRMLSLGLALALLLGWTVAADAAAGKGKKGKKGSHAAHGVVVAVQKDKDGGTITVQLHQHKKKANQTAPAATAKVFKVADATKFQFVKHVKGQKGQKGQAQLTPATFSDVQKGAHVIVAANGELATDVKIVQRGKKNK